MPLGEGHRHHMEVPEWGLELMVVACKARILEWAALVRATAATVRGQSRHPRRAASTEPGPHAHGGAALGASR